MKPYQACGAEIEGVSAACPYCSRAPRRSNWWKRLTGAFSFKTEACRRCLICSGKIRPGTTFISWELAVLRMEEGLVASIENEEIVNVCGEGCAARIRIAPEPGERSDVCVGCGEPVDRRSIYVTWHREVLKQEEELFVACSESCGRGVTIGRKADGLVR